MVVHHHSFGRESAITGLIGAGTVALFFLLLDSAEGRPFTTPSVLGQVILFRETAPVVAVPVWEAVVAYSALHVAAFLVFGMLVTWLVFLADRSRLARFGLLMLLVAFEAFFTGLMAMLAEGTAGLFPLWKVLAANTLAVVAMGAWLLPRHPALLRGLAREPLGS
jgi:hypothetical protein